jgi:hypothetical protein
MSLEGGSRVEKKEHEAELHPITEAFLASYRKHFQDDPVALAAEGKINEVLEEFFKEQFESIKLEKSEKFGVAYPVSEVSLHELAARLADVSEVQPAEITDRKYIFGSAPTIENGRAQEFTEIALHEMVKRLPAAIERMKKLEAPEDYKVVILGYPTNSVSEVTEDFTDEMVKDPVRTLAELYAERIRKDLETKTGSLELHGVSMGAGIAAVTAETILSTDNVVSQDPASELPQLSVRAEVPVSLGPSNHKTIQIPLGFLANAVLQNAVSKFGIGGAGGYVSNVSGKWGHLGRRSFSNLQLVACLNIFRSRKFQ